MNQLLANPLAVESLSSLTTLSGISNPASIRRRGRWPGRVREAALEQSGYREDATEDRAVELLAWIQKYFERTGAEKVSAATLVGWLNEQEDAPFGGWNGGHGLKRPALRPASAAGLSTPEERFTAFQDPSVSSNAGNPYDEYFGHSASLQELRAAINRNSLPQPPAPPKKWWQIWKS